MAETPELQSEEQETQASEVLDAVVIPRRTRTTQAEWDASRKERKARAATTVEANAKEAEKVKKKALAKAHTVPGAAAFAAKAKKVQKYLDDKAEADSK